MEYLERTICSLLEPGPGDLAREGWGELSAALASEQEGKGEEAQRHRERALELWALAEHAGEEIAVLSFPGGQLLLAEALRRCGRFEEARSRCHRGLSGRPGEPIRRLLEFELELISRGDDGPHSAAGIVGPGG